MRNPYDRWDDSDNVKVKLSVRTREWRGQVTHFVSHDGKDWCGDMRFHSTAEGAREEARNMKRKNPSWYELDLEA